MWNALRVLLHRPLVSDSHLHLASPSLAKTSFAICTEAATNIVDLVRLYDRTFSIRRAPYLISYATYVAATIHVRIAATRLSTSEAHECLRTCLSVFDQNSETNYAVRKASMVIKSLMRRMDVDLSTPASTNTGPTVSNAGGDMSTPMAPLSSTADHRGQSNGSGETQLSTETGTLASCEPTMVAGEFAADLDVDAIIQSFMQEQQQQQQQMHASWVDYSVAPRVGGGLVADGGGGSSISGNLFNQQGQFRMPDIEYGVFDDNLFGFNSSMLDWYNNPNHTNFQ